MSKPLVSICCLTYNHEKYIRVCLEGFLMQQANFDFEVLIHDDASTDKTADIIREFETKYPNIIKPIYQSENQYSKGVGVTRVYNFTRAQGKYIAMCEGDDYWTDPLKLQKQVDFLEANKDFGVIHTDTQVYYQNSDKFIKSLNKSKYSNLVNHKNPAEALILSRYSIYTLTVLFRASLIEKVDFDEFKKFKMGDLPLWLTFAQHTNFFYLDQTTAVYRKTVGSASNPVDKSTKLEFKISSKEVRLYFAKLLQLKTSTVNEISDQYHKAVLRKKFEDKESANVSKVFFSIHKKSIKDVILLWGCKSRMFNTIVKKVLPSMS